MPVMPPMPVRRNTLPSREELLRATSRAFCQEFVEGRPATELLDLFFISNPKIKEHGPNLPALPFLGRTFSGRASSTAGEAGSSATAVEGSTCEDYFSILKQIFEFIPSINGFAGASQFVVDITVPSTDPDLYRGMRNEGNGVVCVTSKGTFKSIKTGKSWDEEIMYKFSGFDDEGKIGQWEIWADTLSAWAAIH